jgi:uncharacterized protein with GYD domain
MAKFLIEATYTAEGFQGLLKDKAAGRKAAVEKAVSEAGGRLDVLYWALGKRDAIGIVDLPDVAAAAALASAISASGKVRSQTTPLLTAEEVDAALNRGISYRAPGG